jgi:hypothetical protein
LARQAALAKEAGFGQDGDDGFFATLGDNRELHLAALEVERESQSKPIYPKRDDRVEV